MLALAAGAALLLILVAVTVVLLDRRAALIAGPVLRDPLRIGIEREGFARVVLERTATDAPWRIAAPCPLAVNAQRVTPLLEALRTASARYPAADVDLAGAGLDAPVATLTLDAETIAVGGADLSGQRRYLLAGDTVELVPEWLLSLVQGGMSAFAAAQVFEWPVVDARGADGEPLPIDAPTWSALAAVQTIDWPPREPAEVLASDSLTVALDAPEGLRSVALERVRTDRYVALVLEGTGCARLLPADAFSANAPIGTMP